MKILLCVLALATLVNLQTVPVHTDWEFNGDELTIDITSPFQDQCKGTFVNGLMKGQTSTGGTLACGAKKVSEDKFSFVLIDKTFDFQGIQTGAVLGASDVEPLGVQGTDNSNFFYGNVIGAGLAIQYFQDTGLTIDQTIAILSPELRTSTVMVVRIHNQVLLDWKATLEQTNMLQWSLSGDLDQNTYQDLTIEFDPSATEAEAEAEFQFKIRHKTLLRFKIEASLEDGERDVTITWGRVMSRIRRLNLFPPVIIRERTQSLGFRSGGTFNVGIFGADHSYAWRVPLRSSEQYLSSWMRYHRQDLKNLNITNIIMPGTHDAASTDFSDNILDYYLRTQTVTFDIAAQLKAGVRAFDLRILQAGPAFILMHDRVPVVAPGGGPLFMNDVLDIVYNFTTTQISRHEIIILDFHRFLNANSSLGFNFTACQDEILAHPLNTEGRLIPYEDRAKTYGELIRWGSKARVIAAWNNGDTDDRVPFWQGVDQKFDEEAIITPLLYGFFTTQFTGVQTSLVSAQDAINRPDSGPYYWHSDSSTYFSDIGRGPFLNIIHSDFVDQSIMVETAIAMNLMEAPTSDSYSLTDQ